MKTIQPIFVWKNGQLLEGDLLNAYIINDNLQSSCSFYYSILTTVQGEDGVSSSLGQSVADGNVTMDGENYQLWNGSNDDAYSYIAVQLNLTITGEYVPAVPPAPDPEVSAE